MSNVSENVMDILVSKYLVDNVRELYFEKMLPQREVAKLLGLGRHEIRKMFQAEGWDARPAVPPKINVDSKEVHRLYYDERLTQKEIAQKLSLNSTRPIQRIFKENGWKCRTHIEERRYFSSDAERRAGEKERYERKIQRIRDLRENLFGTSCKICGVSKDNRTLAIHRKDGTEHPKNLLRRIEYLESLNPDDWVLLCVGCHRGVHWLSEKLGMDWDKIESHLKQVTHSSITFDSREIQNKKTLSRDLQNNNQHLEGNVEELRKTIFGDKCYFCGDNYEDRRLVIHRKDGEPHQSSLLWSEVRLKSLNPDDWVALCLKCHRYVHWAMENLNLTYKDLE